jgi:hypothetical protein
MRPVAALAVLLLAVPATIRAQATIDPGMSKAQVVAKLGRPAVEKASGTATYLYYRNGAEKSVGMSDVVVLEGDKVVDAVFRSRARAYSGKSSSPSAIPAAIARKHPPVTPPPSAQAAAPPAPGVAATKAAPTIGVKAAQKMPAEKAQEAEIAKPTPQARSPQAEAEKAAAAAKKADSVKAAKQDSIAKATKKP